MVYSNEFKEKARELYPENVTLYHAIENGEDAVINNILYTALDEKISPETVLNTPPDELEKLAKNMLARKALFGEWLKLYFGGNE